MHGAVKKRRARNELEIKAQTQQEPGDDEKSIARYNYRHEYVFVEKLKCVHEGLAELSFLVDRCTEEGGISRNVCRTAGES